MKSPLILIAEDETDLAHILRDTLCMLDYRVALAPDGRTALQRYHEERPDLVVTDVMMPQIDGFTLLRHIRSIDADTPVIVLTARIDTDDVVSGFKMGATDYLRKPFAMRELLVRIEAVLRRQGAQPPPIAAAPPEPGPSSATLTLGRFTLHPAGQLLTADDGTSQGLSSREVAILERLFRAPGRVVERTPLLLALWGNDTVSNARSLHVFISRLRTKLALDPRLHIHNVHGVGYRLTLEGGREY